MKIYRIIKASKYCAWCKKLLEGEDVGYTDQGNSHGICPECKKKFLGDEGLEDN